MLLLTLPILFIPQSFCAQVEFNKNVIDCNSSAYSISPACLKQTFEFHFIPACKRNDGNGMERR